MYYKVYGCVYNLISLIKYKDTLTAGSMYKNMSK